MKIVFLWKFNKVYVFKFKKCRFFPFKFLKTLKIFNRKWKIHVKIANKGKVLCFYTTRHPKNIYFECSLIRIHASKYAVLNKLQMIHSTNLRLRINSEFAACVFEMIRIKIDVLCYDRDGKISSRLHQKHICTWYKHSEAHIIDWICRFMWIPSQRKFPSLDAFHSFDTDARVCVCGIEEGKCCSLKMERDATKQLRMTYKMWKCIPNDNQ